ncbi:hypothetical protein [Streptomyces sp. NPDC060035]|uniref:hypothetical protein n=1 Tax=Streptomyces sp. NPDC060035 TaxID=3347044 RepID=UPI0036A5F9A0
MNPDTDTAATGPSGLVLPLALAAELAARRSTDGPRSPEVRTATTSRGRRAARRRATAVRG